MDDEHDPRGLKLTRAKAAQLAGVEPHTITTWVSRGILPVAGRDSRGRPGFWSTDVARAEKATRKGARRNVGLRTIATQEIDDHEAVLVRLACRHLKILSVDHDPRPGRPVACFECSGQSVVDHVVTASAPERNLCAA